MKHHTLALVAGFGVLAGAAGQAQAQEVSVVEGPGYPVGEGTVIHPTVGAELGVINNVFYEESSSVPHTSGILRLVAEAALASKEIVKEEEPDPLLDDTEPGAEPAAQKVQFRASGRLAYSEYLSPTDFVRAQRTLAVDLRGHVVAAPEGTFSFSADDRLVRDTHPTNFESFGGTNRIANNLALAVKYQPGGRQITGQLRWENQIDYFENGNTQFASRMLNDIHARGEWKWAPFTLFYADASIGFTSDLGGEGYKQSAMPIRGGVGVATSITELFTVKAHLGWGYAGYSAGEGYNTPVVGAEVGYRYSPVGRVSFLYDWDSRDSINSNYYRDHRFGARVDQAFGAKIIGTAFADLRLRAYRGISPMLGAPSRDDLLFAVGANVQYVLKDWMAIVGNYRTEIDQTAYVTTGMGPPDDPSYVFHEVTAGVRAAF